MWPWRMIFNANKTKTIIVSMWHTMHSQLHLLTLDGSVLMESMDFDDILGVTFDAKIWPLRIIYVLVPGQLPMSRYLEEFLASISWSVATGEMIWGFILRCGPRQQIHTWLRLLDRLVSGASLSVPFSSSICCSFVKVRVTRGTLVVHRYSSVFLFTSSLQNLTVPQKFYS